MSLLAQFLLRLAFGLAFGMAITSPRLVSSGYFRNHLYVTLGLATLAALAAFQVWPMAAFFAVAAAILSYLGAVCWLYEAKGVGIAVLWFVFWTAFISTVLLASFQPETVTVAGTPPTELSIPHINPLGQLKTISVLTSGLVLGITTAAMLLGHWYLNAPGMELAPLRRLLVAAAIAILLQAIVSAIGLVAQWNSAEKVPLHWVMLRWSFGIVGVLGLLWMAWQTLKIPNTQSATGILYVAVIGVFIGELASALLSAESAFPL